MHLKSSSAKWRPFCLGFNVLFHHLRNISMTQESPWSLGCCDAKLYRAAWLYHGNPHQNGLFIGKGSLVNRIIDKMQLRGSIELLSSYYRGYVAGLARGGVTHICFSKPGQHWFR